MTKVLRNTDPYFGASAESFDTKKPADMDRLNAHMAHQMRAGTIGPAALLGLYGGVMGGVLGNKRDNTAAGVGIGALAGLGLGAGLGYALNSMEQNMFRDRYGIPAPHDVKPSREKSASYILGVYRAGIDAGILAPTTFEKMAQQADIASAATQDEMMAVGNSITAQDISSLAKILSVLTQLQQMYQEGSQQMPMEQGMAQQMPMDQGMMQQMPMNQGMMQQMPPQQVGGMMSPGPGPMVQ